jgi:hypothetical protein
LVVEVTSRQTDIPIIWSTTQVPEEASFMSDSISSSNIRKNGVLDLDNRTLRPNRCVITVRIRRLRLPVLNRAFLDNATLSGIGLSEKVTETEASTFTSTAINKLALLQFGDDLASGLNNHNPASSNNLRKSARLEEH